MPRCPELEAEGHALTITTDKGDAAWHTMPPQRTTLLTTGKWPKRHRMLLARTSVIVAGRHADVVVSRDTVGLLSVWRLANRRFLTDFDASGNGYQLQYRQQVHGIRGISGKNVILEKAQE